MSNVGTLATDRFFDVWEDTDATKQLLDEEGTQAFTCNVYSLLVGVAMTFVLQWHFCVQVLSVLMKMVGKT